MLKNKRKNKVKKTRTVQSYWNELSLIVNIRRCCHRYLLLMDSEKFTEKEYAEREKLEVKIRKYCLDKERELEEECLKATGKPIDSCLHPYVNNGTN